MQDTFHAIFDQAPVGMAYVSLEGKWLAVNQRLCEITGYSSEELLAKSFQQITHPDDLSGNLEALARLASGGLQTYAIEKRYIRKDGYPIWVKVAASPMRDGSHGQPLYFVTTVEEISEYKRAQELRLKSEEKCSKAFRQTPMPVVLISLKDGRFVEVNDAFEVFTGYSRQDVIGRTSKDLDLFVDPIVPQAIIGTVAAGDRVRGWETNFRAKDGRIGSALFFADVIEIDGEPCLIGAALDITDRKRLESELDELSGRLIEAQDQERKRIAAELSDSLGQSVTVISFEACQLARKTPGKLGDQLQALCAKIRDVATEIAILSQSIHPSGMDFTVLPCAIQSLCHKFTHVFGLQVAFKHEGVPTSVPRDLVVGLYRIVEEALKNVVQHSGTRQAWIALVWKEASIHLDIWDKGMGFDVTSTKAGLGILKMRERCRSLNGWLVIRKDEGARIEVNIPVPNLDPDLLDAFEDAVPHEDAQSKAGITP